MNVHDLASSYLSWLERTTENKSAPDSIVAYYIALREMEFGYFVTLVGSAYYDAAREDWALNLDYFPSEESFVITFMDTSQPSWEEFLQLIMAATRQYVSSSRFEYSCMRKAKAIGLGFVDGDLWRIV